MGWCRQAFLLCVFMVPGWAAIASLPDQLPLGPSTEWLADDNNRLANLRALREHPDSLNWQSSDQDVLSFGFTPEPHWFRMTLPSLSEQAEPARYLVIPEPLLNHLDVYVLRDGLLIEQFETGIDKPFEQRPFLHRDFVFPIRLDTNAATTVYARVQTNGSLQFEPALWKPSAFAETAHRRAYASGALYGIMLVMLFYNLFLYLVVRDRNYLFYVAFVATFTGFLAALNGDGYQFIWPNSPVFQETAVTTSVALIGVTALLFTRAFLGLREHLPVMHRISQLQLWITVALTLLSPLLSYSISIRVNSLNGILIMFTIMVSGCWMLAMGFKHARYLVAAWTALVLGTMSLSLSKFGLLPWNPVVANGAQIGAVAEVILLSFALGDRINRERSARFAAQQEALDASRQAQKSQRDLIETKEAANRRLEQRVAERTQELEGALKRLESVNEFLETVSNTDQLTRLHNRHYFMRRFHEEIRRAQRLNTPISLIMLDIDHFKHFNDCHGHLVGDECLAAVAKALESRITRAGDTLARFGGEEFIVLLANTDLRGARTVAERLRSSVAELAFTVDSQHLPITVSLGVAQRDPDEKGNPETLIQRADEALYLAKHNGRNRVEIKKPLEPS